MHRKQVKPLKLLDSMKVELPLPPSEDPFDQSGSLFGMTTTPAIGKLLIPALAGRRPPGWRGGRVTLTDRPQEDQNPPQTPITVGSQLI
jgi:hypothetical protein